MKKIFLLVIISLLLTGCNDSNISNEKIEYNNYIKDLKNTDIKYFNNNIPFNIEVFFEKDIETEITYRVIIDNPTESIKKIKAIAIHNYKTEDIFPTSGIFEEELNLIPDVIDVKNNNVEGIILIGYIEFNKDIEEFNGTVKVLVTYEDKNNKKHKVYYQKTN
ncbi:MAG: hypothetical protein PHQ89_03125 [Bacilli bacterium]|nr:hypothetical protein [Bacilli bacterium]